MKIREIVNNNYLIDLITDNYNTPFWEIAYHWHRTYQAKGIQYQHFVGEITNTYNIPEALISLLDKQCKLVNEGVFSVDEIIGDKIKAFELKLQNKNVTIVNLYIEGNGVDFCIVEKNKEK